MTRLIYKHQKRDTYLTRTLKKAPLYLSFSHDKFSMGELCWVEDTLTKFPGTSTANCSMVQILESTIYTTAAIYKRGASTYRLHIQKVVKAFLTEIKSDKNCKELWSNNCCYKQELHSMQHAVWAEECKSNFWEGCVIYLKWPGMEQITIANNIGEAICSQFLLCIEGL